MPPGLRLIADENGGPLAIGQDVADFQADLERRNLRSRERTLTYVRDAVVAAGWRQRADISGESIEAWLADEVIEKGWRSKTHNNALSAIRSFCHFLKKRNRLTDNPALTVEPREPGDSDDGMRPFELEEMQSIITAAGREHPADLRRNNERKARYVVAATTPLRKGAIEQLRRRDIRFNNKGPDVWIRLPAKADKAKKRREIPVPPETAELLRAMCNGMAAEELLFPTIFDNRTLFADMEAAGVPRVRDGEPAAFHSFKKGYMVLCDELGASPALLADLGCHTDPRVSYRSYARSRMDRKRELVAGFPAMDEQKSSGPGTPRNIAAFDGVVGLKSGGVLTENGHQPLDSGGKDDHTASAKSPMITPLPQFESPTPTSAVLAAGTSQFPEAEGLVGAAGSTELRSLGVEVGEARR